jgi:flagellar biosynthesis/type III secretory pathway chaperone
MRSPTQSQARTRIVDLLGQSVYQALGLMESLAEENSALEAQDSDALLRSVDIKSACVSSLKDLEAERKLLCKAAGFDEGPSQMEEMTAWCDQEDVVHNAWHHLLEIAEKCNSLNLTNGAVIRARQQHFEVNLAVLRGAGQKLDTYARGGTTHREMNQRSLAEA